MICGHSTADALRILHDELRACLDDFENLPSRLVCYKLLTNVVRSLCWESTLLSFLCTICLLTVYLLQRQSEAIIFVQVVILTISLITNLSFTIFDEFLKTKEPVFKAKKLLNLLTECYHFQNWNQTDYLDLHCPSSQCISMQWTIRDSKIINLPIPLLVEGDVILLRPGQIIPAKTQPLKSYADDLEIPKEFIKDEHYTPSHGCSNIDELNKVLTCLPLKPEPYIMQETPFLELFRQYLTRSYDRSNYRMDKKWLNIYVLLLRRVFLVLLIIMILINCLRYKFYSNLVSDVYDMVIFLQVECFFPLLPLFVPIVWKLIDYYGSAKILLLAETLNDESEINSSCEQIKGTVFCRKFVTKFVEVMGGNSENFPRYLRIAQILGNVTSVCCVDKKGILSWPNPTPEKVFFLSRNKKLPLSNSFTHSNNREEINHQNKLKKTEAVHSAVTCQVLNLTQDVKNHSHLFFDDHAWEMYMNSLKPLGLSILLNTCNLETIEQYTEFADHVSCMSHKHKEAIPVVNRRCFCELTRQIGFGQNAKEIFQTQNVYGIYQHVDSRCSSEDKSHTEKYKMPMPSMFCVAVKDLSTNTTQLFSQGMADILLNLCTDYWDGQNVQPLAEAERKKIADFYHRTSMTSYCTAFSYRPLEDVSLSIANDFYYEIPEAHFLSRNHVEKSFSRGEEGKDGLLLRPNYHEFSGPSYVDSDLKCYSKQPFKMLNNQIFIGMVTMQYQAKQEVVNLIENLESSCIRFVHFSKENELRSRVFSEKMGLEAGWNCHISLLTDSEEKQLNETSSTLEWQKRVTKPFNHSKSGSAPHINMYCSQYHADNLNDKLADSPALAEEYDPTKSLQKNRSSVPFHNPASKVKKFKYKKREVKNSKDFIEGKHLISTNEPECSDKLSNCSVSLSEASSEFSSYIEGVPEIQNRAKLPKGIENIRPHINNIDNVPLQVSLFTDCSTSTTCEMLKILQEYGEVTCCLGSSLNIENFSIFLQADCSISIHPIYPYLCLQKNEKNNHLLNDFTSPFGLSSYMISLPCSLLFNNCSLSRMPKLIAEAQKHCQRVSSAAHLYLSLQMSLVLLQLMTTLFFLPPCLTAHQVTWLSLFVVPLISFSMMNNPSYSQIPNNLQGKNRKQLLNQTFFVGAFSFLVRFVPTIAVCLLCFALNLRSFCVNGAGNSTVVCHINFGEINKENENSTEAAGTWNGWTTKHLHSYVICQQFIALQLVTYFMVISYCNIHHLKYFWRIRPKENVLWCFICPVILVVQASWFTFLVAGSDYEERSSLGYVSTLVWPVSLLWVIGIITIHELVKRKEMKIWIRHQKRAKLDFGTKLGMNSPF